MPAAASARSLVALHGFTGSPASFAPLCLATSYQTFCPLLTGHGPDPDRSSLDFESELRRLAGLVERAPKPRHLLGYSMGARVGLGLCARFGHLFASATLVGVHPGLSTASEREERHTWEETWIGILESDGLAVFEHHWRRLPLFASQRATSDARQRSQQSTRLSHTAIGLAHAMKALGLASMPSFWEELPSIRIPVTLVAGGRDQKFVALARRAANLLPNGRLEIVDDVGHNPLMERPESLRALLDESLGLPPMQV